MDIPRELPADDQKPKRMTLAQAQELYESETLVGPFAPKVRKQVAEVFKAPAVVEISFKPGSPVSFKKVDPTAVDPSRN